MTMKPRRAMEEVRILDIKVNERSRKDMGNIEGLASNIAKHGLINPILVHKLEEPEGNFKYELVAGERRYRAHIALNRLKIPVIIDNNLSKLELLEIELSENLDRKDFTWQESTAHVAKIHRVKKKIAHNNDEKWTMEDTANAIGVSKASISQDIKLYKELKKRPDVAKVLEGKTKTGAIAEIKKIKRTEEAQRILKEGKLDIDCEILLGDCTELIKNLETNSVDCIITDPPYGLEVYNEEDNARKHSIDRTSIKTTDNLDKESITVLFHKIAPELKRVLKPNGHMFIFISNTIIWNVTKCLNISNITVEEVPLIWYKGKTTNATKGKTFMSCYEPIIHCKNSKSDCRLLKGTLKNVLEYPPTPQESKIHPFQKHPQLLTYLIECATDQGDTVLDLFAGSGSLIQECFRLKRKGIGFELNPEHHTRAVKMLTAIASEGI